MIYNEITEMVILKGIVIVEDEGRIQSRLSEYIKENFLLEIGKASLEDYFSETPTIICVGNIDEWREEISSPEQYQHIIDLNLGPHRDGEGIDILSEIRGLNSSFPSIVFSANYSKDSRNYKQECKELGVSESNFIIKDSIKTTSGAKIMERIIENLNNLIFHENKNRGQYLDLHPFQKIKEVPEYPEVDVSIVDYLCLYNNIDELYQGRSLLFSAKLAYCKFLLSPWRKGYNYFLVQNHLLQGYAADNPVSDQKIIDRTWGAAYRSFDKHMQNIEAIILLRGAEQRLNLEFDNFDTLEAYIKYGKINSFKKNTFYRDITEIFAAKRLAEFCFDHITDDHLIERAVEIGLHLDVKLGQNELIFQLWELIVTSGNNQTSSEVNSLLKPFYKRGYPYIDDIFYCKVETIHEEDQLTQAIVMSLMDTEDVFARAFDLGMLDKYGINTQNATFKLIIYNHDENSEQRPGRTYFIEPVTPEIYFTRTTFS